MCLVSTGDSQKERVRGIMRGKEERRRRRPLMFRVCARRAARHILVWVRKWRPQRQSPGHTHTHSLQEDPVQQRRGFQKPLRDHSPEEMLKFQQQKRSLQMHSTRTNTHTHTAATARANTHPHAAHKHRKGANTSSRTPTHACQRGPQWM